MIETLKGLTMNEALTLITETSSTMYRTAWVEVLGEEVNKELISVGEEEGSLYFVANDELFSPTIEDIMAKDWCILHTTDEVEEDVEECDNQFFDETVEEMAFLLLELEQSRVTLPRLLFFQELADVFSKYYGEETFAKFAKTGEFSHDEECECVACFETEMKQYVKEEIEHIEDEVDELMSDIFLRMIKSSK